MKNQIVFCSIIFLVILLSCNNLTSETDNIENELLPAPQNFSVYSIGSSNSYNYIFRFNSVEYAESYLLSYSTENDKATAEPVASAQHPPIEWSYLRSTPYNDTAYYFWVRAYDGKNYGHWSKSISLHFTIIINTQDSAEINNAISTLKV